MVKRSIGLAAAAIVAAFLMIAGAIPANAMWKQQAQQRFASCAKGYAAYKAANHTSGRAAYRAYMAGCSAGALKPRPPCQCAAPKHARRR